MGNSVWATSSDVSSKFSTRRFEATAELVMGVIFSVCALVFSLLLIYFYATYVSVTFAYLGHFWIPNYFTMATGLLIVSCVAFFLPRTLSQACDIFIYVMFIMAFLPSQVIPSTFSQMETNAILAYQVVLAICFIGMIAANSAPAVKFNLGLFSVQGYAYFLVVLWLIMMLPIVYYLGIPSSIPGVSEVYAVRSLSRDSLAAAPSFVAFLYTMMAHVVSKLLFVYGLVFRRMALVIAGVGTSVYLYGISGHKAFLVNIAVLMAIIAGIMLLKKTFVRWIIPAVILVVLLSGLADLFIGSDIAKSLLIRRTFIVPGILSGYYHDFFSNNLHTEWGYSFLSVFGSSPYDKTPPFLIGEYFFHNPETSANASIWSDGFANFGYGGMVVATIVACVVIWLFNSASGGRSFAVVASLSTTVLMAFVSSSVFTSLLTHGVLLLLILIVLSPVDANEEQNVGQPSGIGDSNNSVAVG